jgi:hypothetical protein
VNEFQFFLILSKSFCKECSEMSARSALTKLQSLSLKAQERYRCSHSRKSVGEEQNLCKVCTGWLKAQNLSTKG